MLKTFIKRQILNPNVPKQNFATNEKAVKSRMKAVDSIRKITKAMKMVAASKMRLDMLRLSNGKEFGYQVCQKVFQNDSYVRQKMNIQPAKKVLVVPITTDRLHKKRTLRFD